MKAKKPKLRSTVDVRVPNPKKMSHGMPVDERKIGNGFSRVHMDPKVHRRAPKVTTPKINPKTAKRY